MFKKLSLLATTLLAVPASMAFAAETTTPYNCDYSPSCEVAPGVYGAMASPATSKFNLSVGGYVKLDYAHNSNATGPRSVIFGSNPVGGSKDESILTAKQSRFWLKTSGPTLLGAKTNALVEADFYGGNSSSNENGNLRMRHAFGSLDWATTQVLFGQFWDIFGPGSMDTIDFAQGGPQGAPNAPRIAQLRVTQKYNFTPDSGIKLVVGAQNALMEAGSGAAGTNAQPTAPANSYGSNLAYAGQLMFTTKALGVTPGFMGLGMSPLQVGVFGQYEPIKIVGRSDVDTYGYGAYAYVPILKSADGKHRTMTLALEGQIYKAAGMSGQLATATALNSGGSAAKGFGFYGQAKFYPTQELGITAGYGKRQADNFALVAANGEKYNSLAYVNATYDLNAAIRVATEYEHAESSFKVAAGPNYGQNNIFRLAAYYFF